MVDHLFVELGKTHLGLHGDNELFHGDLTISISVGVVESLLDAGVQLFLPLLGLIFDLGLHVIDNLLFFGLNILFNDRLNLILGDDVVTVLIELVHDLLGGLVSWGLLLLFWAAVSMVFAELWALWLWPVVVACVSVLLTVVVSGGIEVSLFTVGIAFWDVLRA